MTKRLPRLWHLIDLLTTQEKRYIANAISQYEGTEVHKFLTDLITSINNEERQKIEQQILKNYSHSYLASLRKQALNIVMDALLSYAFADPSTFEQIKLMMLWIYLGNRKGVGHALPKPAKDFKYSSNKWFFEDSVWRIISAEFETYIEGTAIPLDVLNSMTQAIDLELFSAWLGNNAHTKLPMSIHEKELLSELANLLDIALQKINLLKMPNGTYNYHLLSFYYILSSILQKLNLQESINKYVSVVLELLNESIVLRERFPRRHFAILLNFLGVMFAQSGYLVAHNVNKKHILEFEKIPTELWKEIKDDLPIDYQIVLYPTLYRWYVLHGFTGKALYVKNLLDSETSSKLKFVPFIAMLIGDLNISIINNDEHLFKRTIEKLRELQRSNLWYGKVYYIANIVFYLKNSAFNSAYNFANLFYQWARRHKLNVKLPNLLMKLTNYWNISTPKKREEYIKKLIEIYREDPIMLRLEKTVLLLPMLYALQQGVSVEKVVGNWESPFKASELESKITSTIKLTNLRATVWLLPLENIKQRFTQKH
ncbi:MAG: hypothetical protein GXO48_02315 [Chlorobi bacterium]|nr:hypothetical protein [Chlorobiota bacterium]